MKKFFVAGVVGIAAVLVLAALVGAAPAKKEASSINPAKSCKTERAKIGVDAFAAKYGTNPNKRNAFGKCVSNISKGKSGGKNGDEKDEKDETDEKDAASAAKKCRTAENAAKIGIGKTWRNFGACVKAQQKPS
jgi:hypothetical protein